jgi:superfamily II DNA or RNA helicase
VPEASIAIVLSGTGSRREYVQRLGRILRRGEGKLAVLYEVVAEATSEEQVSRRRRQGTRAKPYPQLDLLGPGLLAAEGDAETASKAGADPYRRTTDPTSRTVDPAL